jgi:hypothetical protein
MIARTAGIQTATNPLVIVACYPAVHCINKFLYIVSSCLKHNPLVPSSIATMYVLHTDIPCTTRVLSSVCCPSRLARTQYILSRIFAWLDFRFGEHVGESIFALLNELT